MDVGRRTITPISALSPPDTAECPPTLNSRLRALDVSLGYFDGDRTNFAVDSVSLDIPARGFVGVMGPSGSGKSSLLYLLSGLKRPTQGDIELDGQPYSKSV